MNPARSLLIALIVAVIVLFPEGTVGMIKRKLLGTALEKYIL